MVRRTRGHRVLYCVAWYCVRYSVSGKTSKEAICYEKANGQKVQDEEGPQEGPSEEEGSAQEGACQEEGGPPQGARQEKEGGSQEVSQTENHAGESRRER